MDAPTEWTYGGKLDWSSADSLRLAPLGMAIRCIVEALKERAEAASYTLPAILTEPYNPFQVPSNVIPAIQISITNLLTSGLSSVNFYKHNVDITTYDYLENPIDWTEDTILSEIGSESRLSLTRLNPISAEWAFQQYAILNLMRQIYAVVGLLAHNCRINRSDYKYYSGYGKTQADVNADWQYRGTLEINLPIGKLIRWVLDYWNEYQWEAATQSFIQNVSLPNGQTSFTNLSCEIDWFYYSQALYTYNDFGDGFIENVYVKKNSISYSAGDYLSQGERMPPHEEVAPTALAAETSSGYTLADYGNFGLALIKFDGENGFKFRDW